MDVVLGLTPKFIVWEYRLKEINEAMGRYLDAGKEIPDEWVKERNEILAYLKDRKDEEQKIIGFSTL